MPYSGEILAGTYQIVDEIGKGGVGIIYRAYHLNLQKYVVVKKIKDNFVGVLEARAEVDILKSLHHTCLPQVYDFIQINQEVYTVMDYIEGHDLKYYIDCGYVFDEQNLWFWLKQLLEVLAYLHRNRILHLDIKPANIMLTPEGNIFLIDFNISLSAENEGMAGISEIYASPEQYRKYVGYSQGTKESEIVLDERTDLYSLGASFYHMMTGYLPSANGSYMYPITAFSTVYSDALIRFVDRLVQTDRKKRFSSADKALHAIYILQRTKEEKRTLRAVFGILITAVVILFITLMIVVGKTTVGMNQKFLTILEEEENLLVSYNEQGEYQMAYQTGSEFCKKYEEELEEIGKQSIYEQIMIACVKMEDYRTAGTYIEVLLEMEECVEYDQYAAVIYAYQGDWDRAENFFARAEENGGSSNRLFESRAEMYAAQGDFGQAVKIYETLYEENPQTYLLRRIAALNLNAGLQDGITQEEKYSYLNQAIEKYEELDSKQQASYTDEMNLVSAYLNCNMESKAAALLNRLAVEFPDRYQVFLELSILEYNKQLARPAEERDFEAAKKYVQRAAQIYDASDITSTDDRLENMKDIINGIY